MTDSRIGCRQGRKIAKRAPVDLPPKDDGIRGYKIDKTLSTDNIADNERNSTFPSIPYKRKGNKVSAARIFRPDDGP